MLIGVSVTIGILATEPTLLGENRDQLLRVERIILVVFAVEAALRIWTIGLNPRFGGIRGAFAYLMRPAMLLDLLVIIPLFVPLTLEAMALFRVLRVFRLVRLAELPGSKRALNTFASALRSHLFELGFCAAMGATTLMGSSILLFFLERHIQPEVFGSVPRAIWWSVVTFTTVGYGDAVPITPLGRIVAGAHAILGLGIVAMFTGVVAGALNEAAGHHRNEASPQEGDG